MERQRLDWVDALKGLAIVAIVLGHTHIAFRAYLYSFHIPLFLAVSGYLFDESRFANPLEFLRKKVRTILVPYAFLSFISYVAACLVDGHTYPLTQTLRELVVSTRGHISINPTLWYLTCLFVVEVVFYFIAILVKNDFAKAVVVLPLSVLGWVTFQNARLPFSADTALHFLLFFFIGYAWRRYTPGKLAAGAGGIGVVMVGMLITRPDLYQAAIAWSNQSFFLSYAVSVGFALLGMGACWQLSMMLRESKTLRSLGANSMGIFALHIYALNVIFYLLTALGLQVNQASTSFALVATVVCLAVMNWVAQGLRVHAPALMGGRRPAARSTAQASQSAA